MIGSRRHALQLVRRYGRAPEHANTTRVALDAKDAGALAAAVWGAAVIYNCADLGDYTHWSAEGPPFAASILAAESSGAVLVTFSNLHGYGPVDGAMTHDTPLGPTDAKGEIRARMGQEALAVDEAGRPRDTEA